MFLKNRKIISKMKRSKVTDYAALTLSMSGEFSCLCSSAVLVFVVQINLKKILSDILSESQTVWILVQCSVGSGLGLNCL